MKQWNRLGKIREEKRRNCRRNLIGMIGGEKRSGWWILMKRGGLVTVPELSVMK